MNDAYEWGMNEYRWILSQRLDEKMKRGGQILGYDCCLYLIILNLNAQIANVFRVFEVEED